jgi:hypothetical protein
MQPRAAEAATIPAQEIGGDTTLVEEDVVAHITQRLRIAPLAPRGGDVRASLFVGVYRFF